MRYEMSNVHRSARIRSAASARSRGGSAVGGGGARVGNVGGEEFGM